ncbi:phosphatidylserine decarboxylase [uncultured Ferrovibrio sp.]|jgi:phosphatidylserine decarboxylase|uniref:phosphatidylserine decarboxylase n=1 Tax=uncultured Ferrovibrio sp. TaxID=1576913 RepID=UPI002609108F|nr:phosphatidylserine decarboxylase [uncultured Ferrovibrio sp.]
MDTIRSVLVPIHQEGYKFIAIFAAATLILFFIAEPLGWAGVVLTLWCAYFFRDPPRVTPVREGLLISPADGVVQMIERAVPPEELGMGLDPRQRISIFMNVFDVHVNRSPVDGVVTATAYRPGSFVNAALDKASVDNERQALKIKLKNGKEIAVVQIAGLVARRILCNVREGQELKAGQRFGMIRFGSRVDIYLDDGMVPLVIVGQRAVAGETVVAEDNSDEQPRVGEVR